MPESYTSDFLYPELVPAPALRGSGGRGPLPLPGTRYIYTISRPYPRTHYLHIIYTISTHYLHCISARLPSTRPRVSPSASPSPRPGQTSWAARRRWSWSQYPPLQTISPPAQVFRAGTSVQLVCLIRDVTQPPAFIFWSVQYSQQCSKVQYTIVQYSTQLQSSSSG